MCLIEFENIASDHCGNASQAMASDDDDEPDLMLVSSYFPVIVAVLKSMSITIMSDLFRHVSVPVRVRMITYAVICYMDVNRVRTERFERACGFSIMCTAALVLRDLHTSMECDGWSKTMELILDSIWAVTSSTWGALVCLGLLTIPVSALVVWVAVMTSAHVMLTCTVMSTGELLSRMVCYMCMCAVMFFAKRKLKGVDRNAYMRSISFSCLHVLVVGVYVAVPSLAVCMSVFIWSMYKDLESFACVDVDCKNITCSADTEKAQCEDMRLVMQLRQAMNSKT